MALTDILKDNDVISCRSSDSVADVAVLMQDRGVGAVLVLDEARPIGIITDRDIVLRCVAAQCDPTTTAAEDIMTSPVYTMQADAGTSELLDHMVKRKVRRVVLVNDDEEVEGVLSLSDMLELMTAELTKLVGAIGQRRQGRRRDKVA